MIQHRFDPLHRYLACFDDKTGEYTRSNVYESSGKETNIEPFMADFPHLLDIGIMGHCEHGLSGKCIEAGVFCYQKGRDISSPNMKLDDYIQLMLQCKEKVFQVALGGRGDPDCHEHFEEILYETRKATIVPNITTSGYLFTREKAKITKKYCGAAAVSFYETEYTCAAVEMLLSEGVTTNIHFILSEKSIEKAVYLLEEGKFPEGIGAVIFLLYKPVGYPVNELILNRENKFIKPFFELMNQNDQPFLLGFDSCMAPGVLNYCNNAAPECIEPCESSRFSAYISNDLKMYPCSFIQKEEYMTDLKKATIKEAWCSEAFNGFRNKMRVACQDCIRRELCLGGCPELQQINLCSKNI